MMGIKTKTGKPPKPKYNLWQNSAYMISLAWRERKSVVWLCAALALLAVAKSLAELFVTPTIVKIIETKAPLRSLIITIIGFCVALMTTGAADSYIKANTQFGRLSIRLGLVGAIHEKFMTTSYPNTENPDIRQKLDRAFATVQGNNQATEAIWQTLTGFIVNIAGFAVYLMLISSLNPFVILVTLAATICGYFITKKINEWGYRHRAEEAEYSRRMSYVGEKAEDYTLAKDIRIFGMRGWLIGIYDSMLSLYGSFAARRERVYLWADIVDVLLSLLRNGVAYAYLITLTIRNNLPASQFLLYFMAVGGFTAWVTGILSGFAILHTQGLEISNMREFLELPEPYKFADGETIEPIMDKSYEVKLQNVTFRYPGADNDILKNINLIIKPGEKLAVVGLNGAGKTTLIKLICGFYDPTQGEVLFNGENIKKYNRRDYYRHFCAVFQQFSVLAATISENVSQTANDSDPEKIISCLKKAGLTEKINALTQGAQTHIGRQVYEDGIELSGGETQRLMLARALYKDAPVLVLDEPTAALDPIAESDIYNRYNDLTGGRTSIYISHRLASTRFCDRIILLADGVIAEEGTHDSLIKRSGKYAELFEIQSRYYREGGSDVEEK